LILFVVVKIIFYQVKFIVDSIFDALYFLRDVFGKAPQIASNLRVLSSGLVIMKQLC